MQNFIRTFLICLVMSMLLLIACPKVRAEVVQPTGRDTTVTESFDKSAPPSRVSIWTDESGGYDTSNPSLWARNYWVCLSSTDPQYGQCKTKGVWSSFGETSIPLTFTEKRSGMTTTINVNGYHEYGGYGPYNVYSATIFTGVYETKATFYISQAELKKLPVGGIWEAELKTKLMQWDPEAFLADWNAHITLKVSDNNNQQIYLPAFGTADPHVDLNLRPLPGTKANQTMLSGTATLDMCLYDGYNSNSSEFVISPKDDYNGLPGREFGLFSVYHNGQIDTANRIDYKLQILDLLSRKFIELDNWQNYVATKISEAPLRSVHLPGIPQAVVCVPTALRFVTPDFTLTSKTAGRYTGTLHLKLTTQM